MARPGSSREPDISLRFTEEIPFDSSEEQNPSGRGPAKDGELNLDRGKVVRLETPDGGDAQNRPQPNQAPLALSLRQDSAKEGKEGVNFHHGRYDDDQDRARELNGCPRARPDFPGDHQRNKQRAIQVCPLTREHDR